MPRLCLLPDMRSACKSVIVAILWGYFVVVSSAVADDQAQVLIHSVESDAVFSFTVEIAQTPEEQSVGLMHRTELAPNHGMFFVYDTPSELSFWMKNTLIPLDILFIDEEMVIHHIHANAEPLSEDRIPSQGEVLKVIEINGGRAKELGIKVGDKVEIIP